VRFPEESRCRARYIINVKKASSHGKMWGTAVTPDWQRSVRGGLYEVKSGGYGVGQARSLSYEAWTALRISRDMRGARHKGLWYWPLWPIWPTSLAVGIHGQELPCRIPPDRRHRVREKVWRENNVGMRDRSLHSGLIAR
jgi:hypothetical protein